MDKNKLNLDVTQYNVPKFCEDYLYFKKDKVGIRKALKDGADFNGLAKMQTFKNINIK